MSEGLQFTQLPRTLLEQDYAYKLLFIRLTEAEAIICFCVVFLLWVFATITGLDQVSIIGIPLDPFGWWGCGILLASAISFGHKIRPEGSIELVVIGWLEPTIYLSRKIEGDKSWYPNLQRMHFKQSGVSKISLGRLKKKKSFKTLPEMKKLQVKKSTKKSTKGISSIEIN